MNGRRPNAIERDWLKKSAQIPCLACAMFHDAPDTPPEIHHINGKVAPDAHLDTFSLCPKHHRHKDNQRPPRWISLHGNGKAQFKARYMSELQFLEEQKRRIAVLEVFTV